MRPTHWMLWVSLGLCLVGCAERQGIDRRAMEYRLHDQAALALDQTPEQARLNTPIRLGLFFVRKTFPPTGTIRQAEWTSAYKEHLQARLAASLAPRVVSEVVLLEDPLIRDLDPAAVRQAGRRYGAGAVLIVEGLAGVDRFNNSSAWWYATLLGGYLASGTEIETLFLAQGTLYDVASGRLYTGHTVEGRRGRTGPAMLLEDSAVLREAQEAALDELADRIAEDLRRLSGAARQDSSR